MTEVESLLFLKTVQPPGIGSAGFGCCYFVSDLEFHVEHTDLERQEFPPIPTEAYAP